MGKRHHQELPFNREARVICALGTRPKARENETKLRRWRHRVTSIHSARCGYSLPAYERRKIEEIDRFGETEGKISGRARIVSPVPRLGGEQSREARAFIGNEGEQQVPLSLLLVRFHIEETKPHRLATKARRIYRFLLDRERLTAAYPPIEEDTSTRKSHRTCCNRVSIRFDVHVVLMFWHCMMWYSVYSII